MKAAVVSEAGQSPRYMTFADPAHQSGKTIIRVTASALSHVTKSRAGGTHYSSPGDLPFVPGIDGAGVSEAGERVYFFLPDHPYGGMAEFCRVEDAHCIALPSELDDKLAAALAIPGMSSWAALVERAKLRDGETVLINGATGASGRLAIQIAKHLGAGKVIATGRRLTDDLKALGADEMLQLTEDRKALEETFKEAFQEGIDIVLDYLWGPSAETLIVAAAKAAPEGVPIRYVEIGSMTGREITLPCAAIRSSALELMGSGMASVPLPRLFDAIKGVLDAAHSAAYKVAVKPVPLADVHDVWAAAHPDARIVFVP